MWRTFYVYSSEIEINHFEWKALFREIVKWENIYFQSFLPKNHKSNSLFDVIPIFIFFTTSNHFNDYVETCFFSSLFFSELAQQFHIIRTSEFPFLFSFSIIWSYFLVPWFLMCFILKNVYTLKSNERFSQIWWNGNDDWLYFWRKLINSSTFNIAMKLTLLSDMCVPATMRLSLFVSEWVTVCVVPRQKKER